MTTSPLSVSTPHKSAFYQRPNISSTNLWRGPNKATFITTSPKLIFLCSPSSSTSIAEEDSPPPPPPPSDPVLPVRPQSPTTDSNNLSLRGCKACGREEIEKGCNGEGRIQGGIATVPGFGWWPIKAYRPCPGFVASGGRYRRRGQSMDEVAFGRGETTSEFTNDEVQSSKKKQSPRRSRK